MNIFATYVDDPEKSAKALDTIRVNKMVTETAQLVSTVAWLVDAPDKDCYYKPGWQSHPCTKWILQSNYNFEWLLEHGKALVSEFSHRSPKRNAYHQSEYIFSMAEDGEISTRLPQINKLTPHANATIFKTEKSVEVAYRKHLINKWTSFVQPPVWYRRGAPEFYVDYLRSVGALPVLHSGSQINTRPIKETRKES